MDIALEIPKKSSSKSHRSSAFKSKHINERRDSDTSEYFTQGSSDQCPVHCHDSRSRHTDHTCDQMISDQMIMSRSRHTDEQAVVEQLLRQELSTSMRQSLTLAEFKLFSNYTEENKMI